jgi:hypothetical protein
MLVGYMRVAILWPLAGGPVLYGEWLTTIELPRG